MIDLNLIPFGFNPDNQSFLDVGDVPRGKACGCICPSCQTPLIARQGDVKEWHFAHASRDVYAQTQQECKYSFYVSVRMMARQIVEESLEFEMPEYASKVEKSVSGTLKKIEIPFTVTKAQSIRVTKMEIEKLFQNVPVDVCGYVEGTPFVIYFVHPGRNIPPELKIPDDSTCGIVSVSLEKLGQMFLNARKDNVTYKEILHDFLTNDPDSKTWVFHPRYKRYEAEALRKLESLEAQQLKLYPNLKKRTRPPSTANYFEEPELILPATHQPKKRANFECIICHIEWQDWEPGTSTCPKCGSHLYKVLKGYVG